METHQVRASRFSIETAELKQHEVYEFGERFDA
jgi:hypothetical protein